MTEIILAKYGEIALKGLNKRSFEIVLFKNIKRRLASVGEFNYSYAQSTIYIEPKSDDVDLDEAMEKLHKIFGIASLSRVAVTEKNFGAMAEMAVTYLEDTLSSIRSFKVESKRADKTFPMKSPEICRELGAVILEKFPHLIVDVKNPDFVVRVEVRDTHAYIHAVTESGAGGLPVGTSGRAMLLLSGGIDSPVAGYMMSKRGIVISAIHFVSPPYTSERAQMKVEQLCEKLIDYSGNIQFFCVPFTEIQEHLKNSCPEELFTIIMRRLMMEIAQRVSEDQTCSALITGESVGQVASQTLSAIVCTDAACRMPVFRPLIGMDKTEIIKISRQIDTFETSTLPYEDCCTVFTPKHPKLKPSLEEVEKAQEAGNFEELIQKAVRDTERKTFFIHSK